MATERIAGAPNANADGSLSTGDSGPECPVLAPLVQGGAHRDAWPETLWGFWTKINNDWIFNLSGLLAYNFLAALFPLLLLLLAGCGAILQRLSPSIDQQMQRTLAAALPGSTGAILVAGVETDLKKSVGVLLVVGLLSALVTGSRLFVTLEGCFGIVFRLRGRDPLRQNRMAFSMLLLFLVLAPLVFLVSILPADLVAFIDPTGSSPISGILTGAVRLLILFATALLFFGATYAFVPNRRLRWRSWSKNWQGTLVASVLLMLYEPLFGLYQRRLLHADNYGSVAAFAIVIILFLYYLAFILLLGAEINSWVAGQRETAADLPGILHAVQAHHSLRGAAGPTAGRPSEEMQWHSRAWPVRYIEAVLRRARGGHPLTLRLPHHLRAPNQTLKPPENEVTS
ncbi:MAG TPA: YihY/virulence factor BrkB family protein [Ktedonobacterales bacterium]|jgi:membrane protein|nr:YihY/virulence factor BrkB family protein [Ktedonobacterales bacterium]